MKLNHKKIIKTVISVGLIILLLLKINWTEVWFNIKQAKISFVILFTAFYFFGIMISARKWQILAKFLGFKYKYFFYYKSYFLGTFVNNFLPSFVGGDAYRIYSLGQKTDKMKKSSLTVVADRLSGLVGIMILAGFFILLNYSVLQKNAVINILLVTILIGIFSLGVIMIYFKTNFIQQFLENLPKVIANYIKEFAKFRNRKIFFLMMGYSFLFALVGIALPNFFLFKAFGVELNFFDFLSVAFLTNLIASLPISIGNIGVKEWAYVFFFGIFGVNLTLAVTIVMVARVIQMIVSFGALPFYFKSKTTFRNSV